MRLFSVTFITKDTRLGAALVALEGIAYGKPEITPIRGAKVSGNKVKSSDPDGQRLHFRWFHYPEAGSSGARPAVVLSLIHI